MIGFKEERRNDVLNRFDNFPIEMLERSVASVKLMIISLMIKNEIFEFVHKNLEISLNEFYCISVKKDGNKIEFYDLSILEMETLIYELKQFKKNKSLS